MSLIEVLVVTRPEDIVSVFKQSTSLNSKPYRKFVSNVFDIPAEFDTFFAADNTGLTHKGRSDAEIKPEWRVDYLMHTYVVQFMTGPNLELTAQRFTENLTSTFEADDISHEWKELDDLYVFVRNRLFHASVTAMFGEQIFKLQPDFCSQFWTFERNIPRLMKGLPRWMVKDAIEVRERCLGTIQQWNQYLEDHSDMEPEEPTKYDPVFGSELCQRRHKAFKKFPAMSDRAKACEDLSLLWASTANAIHASFWIVFRVLRDPNLLSSFLEDIEPAMEAASNESKLISYDTQKLISTPLVQSLYTETLRLHVAVMVLRGVVNNVHLGKFTIPPGETLSIMSYPLHRDTSVYNTGASEDEHPLDEFWAERFLRESEDSPGQKVFCNKGLEGSWIPYGGGSNICPGRAFAKQEMLLMAALLVGNFDVELVGPHVEIDWRFYGSGTMSVRGKQRFRIRRKPTVN